MIHEPVCVRRAGSLEEAAVIKAWLEDHGVHVTVEDPGSPGVMAFGVTDREGIGIFVPDPLRAKEARRLLAEHDRERSPGGVAVAGGFDVGCEKCGTVNHFPADDRGTVQECYECGEFLDVPEGPD